MGHVTAVVIGSLLPAPATGCQGRPDEGGLALLVIPGMEVVGDPQALEAGLLGGGGVVHQVGSGILFGGQQVANFCHQQILAS
jgi:hypothetical protein